MNTINRIPKNKLKTAIDNEIDLKNLTNGRNNNAIFKPGPYCNFA
jgi:hypothetical protein